MRNAGNMWESNDEHGKLWGIPELYEMFGTGKSGLWGNTGNMGQTKGTWEIWGVCV